ncbi:MAG TPA: HEAT repeat domain-containing protein [Candidatus Binataceae bacterium]|nr:HEAT repeat domain-containing protein [Candidatus Binataceae bacterium]
MSTDRDFATELRGSEAERLDALERLTRESAAPLSDDAIGALIACLGSVSKTVQRRAAEAIAALASRDDRLLLAVRAALSSESAQARWGAAYALGAIDGALGMESAEALLEALADHDSDVRWSAVELLGRLCRIHPREVAARLMRRAHDGSAVARRMALYCLRDYGTASADLLALLDSAAADSDVFLRLAALSALAKLFARSDASGDAAAIALRALESDADAGVRRSAAAALGQLASPARGVTDALGRSAAQTADPSLARAAKTALANLSGSRDG